jgi:hypothetical protein
MERITYSATQETVKLGSTTTILAFRLETGEIRYSKAGISQLLGYTAKWINGLSSGSPDLLESLQSNGFTDASLRVSVKREGKRGATIAETLSLDDLIVLVTTDAERGNPKAVALLSAGLRQYLIDQSRAAFDLSERTQEEKLDSFDQWHEAYLANFDDWAEVEEQEATLAREDIVWWRVQCYEPTAEGYESDPDCYH